MSQRHLASNISARVYTFAQPTPKKTPRDALQEKKLLKTHTKKKKLGNTILV
jgi:hypothetical protein